MSLRIVIWNCGMALHKKSEALMSLRPDIAVIPECAKPGIVQKKAAEFELSDAEWIGNWKQKGLGVFSFGDLRLEVSPAYQDIYELFLPVHVSGRYEFNLLAVWDFSYRKRFKGMKGKSITRMAIRHYETFLKERHSVVVGDFNNSVVWDRANKDGNFVNVKDDLQAVGLKSAYHTKNGHEFGEEPEPTIIWRRNLSNLYHIDYCFMPESCLPSINEISVGTPQDWLQHSDHVPLVVEVDL